MAASRSSDKNSGSHSVTLYQPTVNISSSRFNPIVVVPGEELSPMSNSSINFAIEKIFVEDKINSSFAITEPGDMKLDNLSKILSEFQEHLTHNAAHYIGYPANMECGHYEDLSSLLKFSINNIGDAFKESDHGMDSKKFEVSVLDWFAQQWKIEKDEFWGYVTHGGTEGNLYAFLLGRELLPNGILYASKESHYCISKIARMYRMECEMIGSLTSGEMDCSELGAKLLMNKDRPAIINVNIGTTFKGAIDNLDCVMQTLEDCGFSNEQFYIHCDAAIFGIVSPFLDKVKCYNFKKPIGSVSISGHKFLGSPMPCGVLLTRKRYTNVLSKNIEYISTLDTTISGSRNGHTSIFIWYTLSLKGCKGLRLDLENCLNNARYLRDRLKSEGIGTMLNESSIIVVFERPVEIEFVRRWALQCQRNMAHVVVMPHVTIELLDQFVYDFLQKRKIWYGNGEAPPPCLAEDIGVHNCCCSIHKN